jgi:hypothetical protein
MIATLNEEPEPEPNIKKPPLTLVERQVFCCILFGRLIVGQILAERESEICSLLLREIRAGRWPHWLIETDAIKSAVFGICRESLSLARREAAEELCCDWLLATVSVESPRDHRVIGPSLG